MAKRKPLKVSGKIKFELPAPRLGAKPHNDDKHIKCALKGKADGTYQTSGKAAYAIARKSSKAYPELENALRSRLQRKLKPLF